MYKTIGYLQIIWHTTRKVTCFENPTPYILWVGTCNINVINKILKKKKLLLLYIYIDTN